MSTMIDEVDPSQKVDIILFKELIFGEDSNLTKREKGCLYSRYWEGRTYKSIGEEWNIRGERVSMLVRKAERKLSRLIKRLDCGGFDVDSAMDEAKRKLIEMENIREEKARLRRVRIEERRAEREAHKRSAKLAREKRKMLEKERNEERKRKLAEQAEAEKDLECPDCMVLELVDGEYRLGMPADMLEGFVPITPQTYERWLKEKKEQILNKDYKHDKGSVDSSGETDGGGEVPEGSERDCINH